MSPRLKVPAILLPAALVAVACAPSIKAMQGHLDAGDHQAALELARGDRAREVEFAALVLEQAAAADEDHVAAGLVLDLAQSRAGRRALHRLARSEDRPASDLARIALARCRGPRAARLEAWLEADQSTVRAAAAEAFGRRLDTEKLLSLLLDHDLGVRLAAVRALALRPGDLAVSDELCRSLAQDPDPLVRAAAARTGRALGDDALGCLRRALGDRSAAVRHAALRGLGDLGTDEALSLIADRAAGPLDPTVVVALAELSRREAASGPDRFTRALEHGNPLVRITALNHLEQAGLGAGRRKAAMVRALEDEDLQVVLVAARRLLEGKDRLEDELRAALGRVRDSKSRPRSDEARDLLAALGSASALEELEELLVPEGDEIRILEALPRLHGITALAPRLAGLLADSREPVRRAAARAVLDVRRLAGRASGR